MCGLLPHADVFSTSVVVSGLGPQIHRLLESNPAHQRRPEAQQQKDDGRDHGEREQQEEYWYADDQQKEDTHYPTQDRGLANHALHELCSALSTGYVKGRSRLLGHSLNSIPKVSPFDTRTAKHCTSTGTIDPA